MVHGSQNRGSWASWGPTIFFSERKSPYLNNLSLDHNSMDKPGHLWAPRHYEGLNVHPEQDVEAQGCFLEDPGGSGGFPGRLGFLLASQAPTRGSRYLPAAVSPEQVAPKQHLQILKNLRNLRALLSHEKSGCFLSHKHFFTCSTWASSPEIVFVTVLIIIPIPVIIIITSNFIMITIWTKMRMRKPTWPTGDHFWITPGHLKLCQCTTVPAHQHCQNHNFNIIIACHYHRHHHHNKDCTTF